MTERGLPIADGASACPFVAFEDDRDERASVPDHRHRCYAEAQPAPRALAHQQAYCLSSAFPVCPTFQDWARREAARARGGAPAEAPPIEAAIRNEGAGPAIAADAAAAAAVGPEEPDTPEDSTPSPAGAPNAHAGPEDDHAGDDRGSDGDRASGGVAGARPDDEPDLVRRNPPRDWSAPPPWLASSESGARGEDADPPAFLGRRVDPGQGLAGSAADRMAGGPPVRSRDEADDASWVASGGAAGRSAAPGSHEGLNDDVEEEPPPRRPVRRPRAYDQHLGGPDGPDWERPRRYEAYPSIRTRVALPAVPRLAAIAGIVALLALALFFLPGILNIGGPSSPAGSSSRPSASTATASLQPTQAAAPTPVVYTIKKGDTLSKIAAAHGVTIEELMAANPTIKDPNKIALGQQIVIPTPSEAPPNEVGGSTEPSNLP